MAKAQPESDVELAARIRAGDESAFLRLVDRYHGSFLRVARSFASSVAVAEEIVQEAWGAILEGLPSFEGRSSLKTWAFRILFNRARTRAERESRSVPFSAMEPVDSESDQEAGEFTRRGSWASSVSSWDEETPERLLLRSEAIHALEEALAALPAQQRTVVTLRDVEGMDSPDVCNVLGISESNQRVLLHRGRVRLRAALADYFDGGKG